MKFEKYILKESIDVDKTYLTNAIITKVQLPENIENNIASRPANLYNFRMRDVMVKYSDIFYPNGWPPFIRNIINSISEELTASSLLTLDIVEYIVKHKVHMSTTVLHNVLQYFKLLINLQSPHHLINQIGNLLIEYAITVLNGWPELEQFLKSQTNDENIQALYKKYVQIIKIHQPEFNPFDSDEDLDATLGVFESYYDKNVIDEDFKTMKNAIRSNTRLPADKERRMFQTLPIIMSGASADDNTLLSYIFRFTPHGNDIWEKRVALLANSALSQQATISLLIIILQYLNYTLSETQIIRDATIEVITDKNISYIRAEKILRPFVDKIIPYLENTKPWPEFNKIISSWSTTIYRDLVANIQLHRPEFNPFDSDEDLDATLGIF